MDSAKTLSGLQLAACIVRRDFQTVCPKYRLRGLDEPRSKKVKRDSNVEDSFLYRAFDNDAEAANRYLAASPRAVEVFELLGSGDADAQKHGLALLWFILNHCNTEDLRQHIADHVLTRLCEQMDELVTLGDVALHYLLNTVLESIRIAPLEKVRVFMSNFSFYKFFGKNSIPKGSHEAFSVGAFHNHLYKHGVIEDIGLGMFVLPNSNLFGDVMDSEGLFYANQKKQLCILLLLGLKGFNIIDRQQVVRQIFAHIKQEMFIDSICAIRLFILVISNCMNTRCARLSLTLRDTQWSDVPEPVISLTATALSNALSRITSVPEKQDKIVRLNSIIVTICSDFISGLQHICDVSTMASVLLKFDIAQLANVEIVLPVLRRNRAIGALYIPSLKCNYNGPLEYLTLMKFMTSWFDHAATVTIEPLRCLEYIPPLLNPAFFNAGLLSGDESTIRGTLRMLSALLRFLINTIGHHKRGNTSGDVWERLCGVIPDFKTLVNAKAALRKQHYDGDDTISINIKNETKAMVSSELGIVLTGDNKNVILGIDNDTEPLTDWLECLHAYSTLVGVGDGRSLYDPCKLLKEDVIMKNIDTLNTVIRGEGDQIDPHVLLRVLKLDMALVDCLFMLGVGEVHSGVALTKVQNVCFSYILRRYVELKSLLYTKKWDMVLLSDYLNRCQRCLIGVLESSGVFPVEVDIWLHAMRNETDIHIFVLLFTQCTESPLESLLGDLTAKKTAGPTSTYRCLNCFGTTDFRGSLFVRVALEFLLQLCSDYEHDLECGECHTRQINFVKAFMKKRDDAMLNPITTAQYILRVCSHTNTCASKGCVKRVIQLAVDKYDIKIEKNMVKMTGVGLATSEAESVAAPKKPIKRVQVENGYLTACSRIIDAINVFNQDILVLKELGQIIIDVISMRLFSSYPEETLKRKWDLKRHNHIIDRFANMEVTGLYTHLFCTLVKILESTTVTLDKTVLFHGVEFKDDLRWSQLHYLKHLLRLHDVDSPKTLEHLLKLLKRVCSGSEKDEQLQKAITATVSVLCTMIPAKNLEKHAVKFLDSTLKRVKLPIECCNCTDVISCNLGYNRHLIDVATYLATVVDESEALGVSKLLTSQRMWEITKAVCEMNNHRYFVGDAIEAKLLLSHLKLLRSMLCCIGVSRENIATVDRKTIYRLLDALAGCYRCSYSECDLILKDIITRLVDIIGRLLNDPKSFYLKLPPFKDFICISEPSLNGTSRTLQPESNGTGCTCNTPCHHETLSHGMSRGWPTMASGFSMLASNSNWLCLNDKRVLVTGLCFPSGADNCRKDLKYSYCNLSILYPPTAQQSAQQGDVVFGTITRLNKILGNHSNYLEQLIAGDPYVYDVTYLIPYFTGRLCAVLHDQLYQYKHDLEDKLQSLAEMPGTPSDGPPNRFVRSFSLMEAKSAMQRLRSQMEPLQFDISLGDTFTPMVMEQVVRNGVLELCTLGLVRNDLRKDALKALGLIIKLVHNMIDAAMVRSFIPGNQGPYKLRRIGLFGIQQVHALLCFIQRCRLYANMGDPVLSVVLASQLVRHVTKPEDPLYNLGNKFLISRFQPRMDDVPLFFDCFNVHGARERMCFLSFVLQLLLTAAHLVDDCGIFSRRRVLQQLFSFTLVETTSCEHRVQICAFIQRCVIHRPMLIKDLYAIGIAPWISSLSLILCNTGFKQAKGVVLNTMLLCSLTMIVKTLGLAICGGTDGYPSPEGSQHSDKVKGNSNGESNNNGTTGTQHLAECNVRDVVAIVEALQRVAEAWSHILGHIPKETITPLQMEGYGTYMLAIAEVISVIKHKTFGLSPCVQNNAYKLLLEAINMADHAITKTSSMISTI
ncbi:nucleolar pre-ribosomal protein-associated 1, putative [Babesia ovis]|uniref:Nucleolar pre-ribosomal protein-associated 1, putative n=1 Tax=Babesia ovis TaxID=5869 RepID=A0A9W5WVG8_BABOV|nr:nucleolar pre-ribosomal protein-associated 1, putative [Babesia ovis]